MCMCVWCVCVYVHIHTYVLYVSFNVLRLSSATGQRRLCGCPLFDWGGADGVWNQHHTTDNAGTYVCTYVCLCSVITT